MKWVILKEEMNDPTPCMVCGRKSVSGATKCTSHGGDKQVRTMKDPVILGEIEANNLTEATAEGLKYDEMTRVASRVSFRIEREEAEIHRRKWNSKEWYKTK